ncbi:hypothetical protein KFK09_015512 [Dendrobium nobile]|uniref:Uncharacterized protein n=1 Tax=Dendrobium nobile TaxID=94219 RepID=A0A8T3B4Z8_DENNO|nr:hypothetical protein KFK09_015512 [Dendrobium nobile]
MALLIIPLRILPSSSVTSASKGLSLLLPSYQTSFLSYEKEHEEETNGKPKEESRRSGADA